jgi:hypothetical protein
MRVKEGTEAALNDVKREKRGIRESSDQDLCSGGPPRGKLTIRILAEIKLPPWRYDKLRGTFSIHAGCKVAKQPVGANATSATTLPPHIPPSLQRRIFVIIPQSRGGNALVHLNFDDGGRITCVQPRLQHS